MRSPRAARPPRPEDLTARSRIRDAAIHRFAVDGFAGASVRAIADDAGVSAALVMHHFGSKQGLRAACDEHLVATLTATKTDALDRPMSASALLAAFEGSGDLVAYLGRALTDGSPQAADLFDAMVVLTETMLAKAEQAGTVRPAADPRARAALLTTWGMSLFALGDHLSRVLGVPLSETAGLLRVEQVAVDVYTYGLFTDDRWAGLVAQAAREHQDRTRPEGGQT